MHSHKSCQSVVGRLIQQSRQSTSSRSSTFSRLISCESSATKAGRMKPIIVHGLIRIFKRVLCSLRTWWKNHLGFRDCTTMWMTKRVVNFVFLSLRNLSPLAKIKPAIAAVYIGVVTFCAISFRHSAILCLFGAFNFDLDNNVWSGIFWRPVLVVGLLGLTHSIWLIEAICNILETK